MTKPKFPKGWDETRVQRLIDHYENMSDDEMIAEDEAAQKAGRGQIPVFGEPHNVNDATIVKGTRRQKIIGDFGASLICNWLSRSGFEVSVIDHTGIDIIAYDPRSYQRLGITVKSRTRTPAREHSPVNVFSYQNGKDDRKRALAACKAFGCELWIGVYVEATDKADIYLTSESNYKKKYGGRGKRKIDDWKMRPQYKKQYDADPDVKHVCIDFTERNWDWGTLKKSGQ